MVTDYGTKLIQTSQFQWHHLYIIWYYLLNHPGILTLLPDQSAPGGTNFVSVTPMNQYIFLLSIIGIAAFAMTWMPAITKKTGISYAIIYVAAGALLYLLFPGNLPAPLPQAYPDITLHLAEIVVIISLMGTGIKIDRSFRIKNWASPLKLISVAMVLCIAAAALAGYYFLGFGLAAAVLLGSVLAPTDPVLASDVQVGPPNHGMKSETRFSLTAEAGLNDGMAFPFIWLAIMLAGTAAGQQPDWLHWVGYELVYKIAAGTVMGLVLGRAIGYLVFTLSNKYTFLKTNDGFLAIAMTLMVYALTEMIHGYGFIAVFVSAITFRHSEKLDDFHHELHSVTDQFERLLVAVLLLLFGGALVSGILDSLNGKMVIFTLLFLFVIRPVAVLISLSTAKFHRYEKFAIAFLGIRGMGSIFYLAFAVSETNFMETDELWSAVAFTILVSVVVHGITATPIINFLKKTIPEEEIPH
ncbi:MAG: sodium:proton antiporter [Chitinophagaceae bacterium]|nr:MAG: sodium:proton antiporter [Chitinophagaceae bacterium]